MHSPLGQVRGPNPPLPHQPQAHFYGTPDIDLEPQTQSGMKAGDRGYYFGFDTLPSPAGDYAPGKGSVALAGYEGGLEVYSMGKRGLEYAASLRGLRGGVIYAKILPWTLPGSDLFPLVAVVIHGPCVQQPSPAMGTDNDYDAVSAERSETMANVNAETASRDAASNKLDPAFYQTTVEVYSLATGAQVGVLLEAPKIPLKVPIPSPVFQAPPASGAFHIRADGGSIVVSSGITGECWVYRQAPLTNEYGVFFRCHGKVWTTLQQTPKGDSSQEQERGRVPVPSRPRPQSAILSLSGRWIAYCPATPSSQISLRASIPVPAYGRSPGLASLTPPQLPPPTSDVDLPLSEGVMNKIMRDATQELIQGAKWVGKQGWQAWNNYWNPQTNQPSRTAPAAPPTWGSPHHEQSQFPPTHGTVTPPVVKEPGIVSILDIESLGASANLHPITTFAIPHGCSFLSLSPSGLSLFTASSKGDVQTVWDLLRIQHTKASTLQAAGLPASGGPRVRQVAQFSRMTVARVVDVAWTRPTGERIAMVTERGTVHTLDLPSSAFTWPPPRRRTRTEDVKGAAGEGAPSAVAMASNAFTTVREAARPLIARPRRSDSNAVPTAGGGIGEYAAHGGKVIAAGISHSLGNAGNAIIQLRHTGENRVALPNGASPAPACVTWIAGRKEHTLFVLGGGLVRTYPAKTRRTTAGGEKRTLRLSRYQDFKYPSLPDGVLSPLIKSAIDPDEYLDFTEKDLDGGNNTMVLHNVKARTQQHDVSSESSIPQAEIESSAPYQPFHTDRRVALYVLGGPQDPLRHYDAAASISALLAGTSLEDVEPAPARKKKGRVSQMQQLPTESSRADSTSAWAFGQPLNSTKLDLGLPLAEEESFSVATDEMRALPPSAMERILQRTGDDDAQIVVTTRRRRGAGHAANQDDDGFFEDDCEVLDFADQRV